MLQLPGGAGPGSAQHQATLGTGCRTKRQWQDDRPTTPNEERKRSKGLGAVVRSERTLLRLQRRTVALELDRALSPIGGAHH